MVKVNKIISSLKEELDNNPLVLGLVLVGSQARKTIYTASPYSDMEIFIIVKDKDVEKIEEQFYDLVKKIDKTIFSYKNQWAGFSAVFDNLFRLELPIAKLSELNSVFSRPTAQVVKVLFDKTNGKLEETLANRPHSIDFQQLYKDKVLDFWYMAIIAVQYFKKGEIWNSRTALQVIQSSLIKLLELLEDPKILLLETNKNIEDFLSKDKVELIKRICPSYNREGIKRSLIDMLDIFPDVFRKISKKYKYEYDRKLEEEIKPKLVKLLNKE